MLRGTWQNGIELQYKPGLHTADVIDQVEVTLGPGSSVTKTLSAGVTYAPIQGWDEEWAKATYRVTPAGGEWDRSGQGPIDQAPEAFLEPTETNTGAWVGLSGYFSLSAEGAPSGSVSYRYDGLAEWIDEAAPAPPPPPPPPAPKPKVEAPPKTEQEDENDRLLKLYDRISRMERRLAQAGVEIHLQGLAAVDLREQIRVLQAAMADEGLYQHVAQDRQ